MTVVVKFYGNLFIKEFVDFDITGINWLRHNAHSEPMSLRCWKPGDILGTFLDLEKLEVLFYLNGELIKVHKDVFRHTRYFLQHLYETNM